MLDAHISNLFDPNVALGSFQSSCLLLASLQSLLQRSENARRTMPLRGRKTRWRLRRIQNHVGKTGSGGGISSNLKLRSTARKNWNL